MHCSAQITPQYQVRQLRSARIGGVCAVRRCAQPLAQPLAQPRAEPRAGPAEEPPGEGSSVLVLAGGTCSAASAIAVARRLVSK